MIFHLCFNTLFVFLVLAFLVELSFAVFRVKNARLRTLCRLIPIIKLPFDLAVFGLFDESYFVNLNPFSCELYLQKFITKFLSLKGVVGENVVIPQYIASKIPSEIYRILVAGIAIVSGLMVCKKLFQLIRSLFFLKKAELSSTLCERPIQNELLRLSLQKQKVNLLASPEAGVPFAAGLRTILFPKQWIDRLSQEEFEAVVSHELEHLRWKDPILKCFAGLVCSLFWWIPTRWWMRRLEADQEQASDFGIHKYNIDALSLVSAFVKTASQTHLEQSAALCPFASKKVSHASRLQNILNSQKLAQSSLKFAAGLGISLLASFSFWAC